MRREPVRALTGEVAAIRRLEALLEGAESAALLIGGEGRTGAELPASVLGALRQVVRALAAGRVVTVVSTREVLTTQQAADLLEVSRPFLVQLLEGGVIPFYRVGSKRRVRLADVLVYRQGREGDGQAAVLAEFVRLVKEHEQHE